MLCDQVLYFVLRLDETLVSKFRMQHIIIITSCNPGDTVSCNPGHTVRSLHRKAQKLFIIIVIFYNLTTYNTNTTYDLVLTLFTNYTIILLTVPY